MWLPRLADGIALCGKFNIHHVASEFDLGRLLNTVFFLTKVHYSFGHNLCVCAVHSLPIERLIGF